MIKSNLGLSAFTKTLEGPRRMQRVIASSIWGDDSLELNYVRVWYSKFADVVRKRLVEQVTGMLSLCYIIFLLYLSIDFLLRF